MPRSESGRAGRVEKFLVFGILVVIGLILVVAINGANKIDEDLPVIADEGEGDAEERSENARGNDARRSAQRNAGDNRPRNNRPLRNEDPGAGRAGSGLRAGGPATPTGGANSTGGRPAGSNPATGDDRSLEHLIKELGSNEGIGSTELETSDPSTVASGGPSSSAEETLEISSQDIEVPATGPGTQPTTPPAEERRPPAAGTRRPESGSGSRTREAVERPAAGDGDGWMYAVRSGDSLIGISRRFFGDGDRWPEIMATNRWLGDPKGLLEGHVLAMPALPLKTTEGLHRGEASSAGRLAAPTETTPAPASRNSTSARYTRIVSSSTHTVARGENLMKIAQNCYGTKSAWRLIFEANRDKLPSADQVREGQVLALPVGG